jgi:SNF2 family DNA or RNA helicase
LINDFNFKASFAIEPTFGHYPYREQDNGDKPGEYQHAGVEYVLQRKNGIVGDAPGVGKTLQGIMVSNTIEAERTLVVCPASLRTNWEREIERWSTLGGVSVHTILKGKDGVDLTADYVITSYDLLRNDSIIGGIMERHWDHVILDEAHALKDPKGNKRLGQHRPGEPGRLPLPLLQGRRGFHTRASLRPGDRHVQEQAALVRQGPKRTDQPG